MEVLERSINSPVSCQPDAGAALISAVRELVDGPLAELASDIDRRGVYPKTILQRLGELGALKAHMADGELPGNYALGIQAISEVSRVCSSASRSRAAASTASPFRR